MKMLIPRGRRLAWMGIILTLAALLLAGCMAEGDRDENAVTDTAAVTGDGTTGDDTTGDGTDGDGTDGDGATATPFLDVATIIADGDCEGCHGGAENCDTCHPSDGYTSSDTITLDHASMVDQDSLTMPGEKIVDSGSKETSVLYWVVTGDAQYTGAKDNEMKLGSSNQEVIGQWIDDGAAE